MRETGSVLDGKYEIVDRLGTGGMGEVYLVRHLHLQELRVIKILRQDMAADPSAQKRFMREARLATQIKHPNVAILYDFSRLDDGSFYMVWEHIQGEEVGDRVRRHGPFPVPVAIQLGIQALRGLEVIHGAGIIHRDLSPDNLMIMEDKRGQPTLKIIDLGLARTLETETDARYEITQVGMFMGKLQYCSPEQAGSAGNQPLDARSDLYSFALVLYEMITGMVPFDSENQAGFIFKRLAEDPLPLTGRNPYVDVPSGLDRAVRKALERDREKRYPDAGTFIQALERLLQGMTAAETREIPISSFPPEARPPAQPRPRSTSTELSKAEKDDLLAQIERAAKRVQENASEMAKIEQALGSGNVEEAARLIAQVEAANPRTAGLDRARIRLAEMKQTQESESQRKRVTETEQVLTQYLQRKQLPLARLALSTLVELSPSHPKRSEYEGWIEMLGKELEQSKRADAALAAGRAALARRDFAAARRELENVARDDPSGKRAEAFADELDRAEREAGQDAEVERRMRDLEKALAEQRIADAGRLVDELSRYDVPRVTLDFYRERVQEFRSADQLQEKVNSVEWLYRKHVEDKDWFRAREAASELAQAFPSSPRTAQMYSEIERLETAHRRELAVEQGVRQVETFIEQSQAAKAELALKILVQMDPDNRHRKRLERQVRALPK